MEARKINLNELTNLEEAKEFRAIFGDREVEITEFKEKLAKAIEKLQVYVERQELLKGLLNNVMEEGETIGRITKCKRINKKPTEELVVWLKDHKLYSRVVDEKISMRKLNGLMERYPEIDKMLEKTETFYVRIR
mgnify:CR=1 FL=1